MIPSEKQQTRLALLVTVVSLTFALGLIFSAKAMNEYDAALFSADLFSTEADPDQVYEYLTKIEGDTELPHGSIESELVPTVIRVILGLFSVILTGVAIYSGILFVGQFGNEERITTARNYLIWSLVGIAVTALSYTIVAGILALDFG